MNLESLRKNITVDQQLILDEIWHHFIQNDNWIIAGALYRKFPKEKLILLLRSLGGSIVYTSGRLNQREYYQLTFLGMLLTKDGEGLQDIFCQFLSYVQEQLEVNPEMKEADVTEADKKLELDKREMEIFLKVLPLSPFRISDKLYGERKIVVLPYDIDDLLSERDARIYFNARVMAEYDSNTPTEWDAILLYRNEKARRGLSNIAPILPTNLVVPENATQDYDVFLSYAYSDSQEAKQICDAVRAAGGNVFLSEKNLKPGDDFANEIRKAIHSSKELWLLVSPNSLKSEWVISEWGAAWVLYKKIIPILLNCKAEDAPERIRAKHCKRFDKYAELIEDKFPNR